MFSPNSNNVKSDLNEIDIFLIPTVSNDHTPQLASDLLISSLKFIHIGCLSSKFVIPVCGLSDSNDNLLCTALDVYVCRQFKMAMIQQRSSVLPGLSEDFAKQLLEFVIQINAKRTIVLTSLPTFDRVNEGELFNTDIVVTPSLNFWQHEVNETQDSAAKTVSPPNWGKMVSILYQSLIDLGRACCVLTAFVCCLDMRNAFRLLEELDKNVLPSNPTLWIVPEYLIRDFKDE